MDFVAAEETYRDWPVLKLTGEVDPADVDELTQVIGDFAESKSCIIFDLLGVPYISSRPIGALVALKERQDGRGATMAIVCSRDTVGRLLSIAGLVGELNVFYSLDDAAGYLVSGCLPGGAAEA
jgi:anti-anti-sigma factor